MKRQLPMTLLLVLAAAALGRCRSSGDAASAPPTTARRAPAAVTGAVFFLKGPENRLIRVADFPLRLEGGGEPRSSTSDALGQYRFADVAPGKYTVCWRAPGWVAECIPQFAVLAGETAYPAVVQPRPTNVNSVVWGAVSLADGSAPVSIDSRDGSEETPVVEVLGDRGSVLATAHTNASGQYAIGVAGSVAAVRAVAGRSRQERRLPLAAAAEAGAGALDVMLSNHPPVITEVEVKKGEVVTEAVAPGETVTLSAIVVDDDNDSLEYTWSGAGTITPLADGGATWALPDFPASHLVYLRVSDGKGGADRTAVSLRVGPAGRSPAPAARRCNPLSLQGEHVPPPGAYAATGQPPFLGKLLDGDHSQEYYDNVDPKKLRTTLGAWWSAAGFDPDDGSIDKTRSDNDLDAQAAYLNWNDLGFGRDMHFRRDKSNHVYAWVTNYGCPDNNAKNADLAAKPTPADAVATVCMEYAPVEGQTGSIVKFFVYVGGVKASPRSGQADLDLWGPKAVPNLCQTCHGSNSVYSGGAAVDRGSSFLPFDLARLRYPGGATTPPTADLAAYHTMNRIIAESVPTSAAIVALVNGWYTPLKDPPTQNDSYLPLGWRVDDGAPPQAAGLYHGVIAPSCRTCHYALSTNISWDTYQSALDYASRIQRYVCDLGPIMPHAAVTYLNFWENAYGLPTSPPVFLSQYSDPNGLSFGACTGR